MDKVIEKRMLKDDEVSYLLNIKTEDITLDLLRELFAFRPDKDPKFNPNDMFKLPANTFPNQSSNLLTTVGRYIFNRLILTGRIGEYLEYVNYPLGGSTIGDLESKLANLLLDNKILVEDFSEYIDKLQWIGFATTDFLNPPLTSDLLVAPDSVKKRKAELLSDPELQEKLRKGDAVAASKFEKELLDLSAEELKDLPDKIIYDSGARGSWGNNFKNTAISRGVIRSVSDPSQAIISTSSLTDGIPQEERYAYGDILTNASFSRAIGTRKGGYEAKKLSASFQGVILDEAGSDCKTKLTLKLEITKNNSKLLVSRYIQEGKELIELTEDVIPKYIGKTVSLRSPMYCKNKQICSKCAGELYYKLGIKNVGLTANVIGSTLVNLSLKSFHDTSVKIQNIDPFKYISLNR